jgi:hypothetical protein
MKNNVSHVKKKKEKKRTMFLYTRQSSNHCITKVKGIECTSPRKNVCNSYITTITMDSKLAIYFQEQIPYGFTTASYLNESPVENFVKTQSPFRSPAAPGGGGFVSGRRATRELDHVLDNLHLTNSMLTTLADVGGGPCQNGVASV